jgi:phage baseplate assembly protein V
VFDTQQIKAMQSVMENLFRVGTVSSINADTAKARVTFAERDNLVSAELPVLVKNTLNTKDYWMPAVQEKVLCCFLPIGIETGFILGGFYTDPVPKPEATATARVIEFEDGARFAYDPSISELAVSGIDALNLTTTGDLTINAGGDANINVTGNAKIDSGGNVEISAAGSATVESGGICDIIGALVRLNP